MDFKRCLKKETNLSLFLKSQIDYFLFIDFTIKLSFFLPVSVFYSTVTDLAKLRGWSTSRPLNEAI